MPDYTPIEADWLRVFAGLGIRSPTTGEGHFPKRALPYGRASDTHHTRRVLRM